MIEIQSAVGPGYQIWENWAIQLAEICRVSDLGKLGMTLGNNFHSTLNCENPLAEPPGYQIWETWQWFWGYQFPFLNSIIGIQLAETPGIRFEKSGRDSGGTSIPF
eukprot:12431434-Karenia_brevis.AAC.2